MHTPGSKRAVASFVTGFLTVASPLTAEESPVVNVMVGQSTNRGTTYSYRVINQSSVQVTGLQLGLDRVSRTASLPVPPLSVESPAGWAHEVVRTEESAIWEVGWLEPENGIGPGASLAGFIVRLEAPNSAYQIAPYTIFLEGGWDTDRVIEEAPILPVVVCVHEDAVTHALTARFRYTNGNSYDVVLQVGPANRFVPGPPDRGQPTTFLAPPASPEAFSVPLGATESLTWEVGGSTATATSQTPRCTP